MRWLKFINYSIKGMHIAQFIQHSSNAVILAVN